GSPRSPGGGCPTTTAAGTIWPATAGPGSRARSGRRPGATGTGARTTPAGFSCSGGPDTPGWCPTAYYTSYYGIELGAGAGFRWGLYGWAGGGWGLFDRWNFVSASYFNYAAGYRQGYRDGFWDAHRDVQRYAVPIDGREHGPLARGIITTDTKPLKPSVWKDPGGPL